MQIRLKRGQTQRRGILIGIWDESEVPDDLWSRYRGGMITPPTIEN